MLFSKKILISLLVLSLAIPARANPEREKEDSSKPYYYIAASIALGAVGLGAFLKRDAIKGWLKKTPTPTSHNEMGTHTFPPSDAPNEDSLQRIVEVSPVVLGIIASRAQADESTTESTTTASTTLITEELKNEAEEAVKLEEVFELEETVTVTETPLAESTQAPKKLETGQRSEQFLARKRFLEQHFAGQGWRPNPSPVLVPENRTKTVTNDRSDESPIEEDGCPISDLPPSLPENLIYFASQNRDNETGLIYISDAGISIPLPADSVAWIMVSDQYGELDDNMGQSLPKETGYVYCFVNSDATKMILARSLGSATAMPYKDEQFLFWRIHGSSHSTICVSKIDDVAHQAKPQEDNPTSKEVKSQPGLKEKKEKTEKKDKGKKKHWWRPK